MKKKKIKRPPTKAKRLKRVKKALSTLWSKVVRMRDGNKCLMCGKTKGLSAHHWLFAKGHCQPLAYNVCDGATLCYACHIRKLHQNGDGDFILRLCDIMFKIVGMDMVERMRKIAAEKPALSLETMEAMRGILQKMVDAGDASALIAPLLPKDQRCPECWAHGTNGISVGPITSDGLVHRVRLDNNMSVCDRWRLGA